MIAKEMRENKKNRSQMQTESFSLLFGNGILSTINAPPESYGLLARHSSLWLTY